MQAVVRLAPPLRSALPRHAAAPGRPVLFPGLKNEVERRCCRPAEARKTRLHEDAPQPRLPCLCPQPEADLLGQRIRRTDERRGRVKQPSNRVACSPGGDRRQRAPPAGPSRPSSGSGRHAVPHLLGRPYRGDNRKSKSDRSHGQGSPWPSPARTSRGRRPRRLWRVASPWRWRGHDSRSRKSETPGRPAPE